MSLAVLAPSLLLWRYPPVPPVPPARLPRALTALERLGQALCTIVPAITIGTSRLWPGAILAMCALAGYYALWIRYLVRRTPAALYLPAYRIPVPLAILPVLVFLGLAWWQTNPWILASALVLASGHIPSSSIIARAVRSV